MLAPRIRRASVDDLDSVLALINDPRSVHQREACRHQARAETATQLYERLNEDDNLVLQLGQQLVGYASWQTYGRHAHLNVMAIAGAYQRQGHGQRLFAALLSALRGDGMLTLSLRAYADSPWAIGFYERAGLVRYEPGMERESPDGGFVRYVQSASANGLWPAEDKLTFFAPLARLG